MGNFTKVGIKFDNIGTVKPLNINFASNIEQFFADIPIKANQLTGGYFGVIVSTAMFFVLFYFFADQSEYSNFRYSNVRSVGMAACVVSMLGMMFLIFGFFTEMYHIVIFMVIAMICTIWVKIEE